MKTINRFFFTLFIIAALFVAGNNVYFNEALVFIAVLFIAYIIIVAIDSIKKL